MGNQDYNPYKWSYNPAYNWQRPTFYIFPDFQDLRVLFCSVVISFQTCIAYILEPSFRKQKTPRKTHKTASGGPEHDLLHRSHVSPRELQARWDRGCIFFSRQNSFQSHSIHVWNMFTYIWLIYMVNAGKYTIHGW